MATSNRPGRGRPSDREVHKKVADALAAIEAGRRELPLTKHLAMELPGRGRLAPAQLWDELPRLLREIQAMGPLACYAGSRPPQRSYEEAIQDEELWAYHWPSARMRCALYLKFCIINDEEGRPVYWHVDLHVDEPSKGKPT